MNDDSEIKQEIIHCLFEDSDLSWALLLSGGFEESYNIPRDRRTCERKRK
jgi:hypothetical protein